MKVRFQLRVDGMVVAQAEAEVHEDAVAFLQPSYDVINLTAYGSKVAPDPRTVVHASVNVEPGPKVEPGAERARVGGRD